jgi:hypothetical protein
MAARELHLPGVRVGALLFADDVGEGGFERLASAGNPRDPAAGWSVEATGEPGSLMLTRADGARLLAIAGRQFLTYEGLEVLALGCRPELPEREPVRAVLHAVVEAGGVPVLPWGIGKWTLRRGALVRELLGAGAVEPLFVGDNGNRLRGTPLPPGLRFARARSRWNLPGSDPMPCSWAASRVATAGFHLPVRPDQRAPARQITGALRKLDGQPRVWARFASLSGFLRTQGACWVARRRSSVARTT